MQKRRSNIPKNNNEVEIMAKTNFKGWPSICLLLGALVFMGQSCE